MTFYVFLSCLTRFLERCLDRCLRQVVENKLLLLRTITVSRRSGCSVTYQITVHWLNVGVWNRARLPRF